MFLDTVINDLASIELRQLYVNSQGTLTIDENHRREIMANILVVLSELHTKLLIKVGTLKVSIIEGKQRYVILPEHANSSTSPAVKYIDDSDINFKGDLLKILRVLIPVDGVYVDAHDNAWNNVHSFRITQFNEVIVPISYKEDHFIIEYHADADKFNIEEGITSPETIWINIPESLSLALRLGVAAKKMGTVGMTGSAVEGINYSRQYSAEIDRIMFQNNALNPVQFDNTTLRDRGWV